MNVLSPLLEAPWAEQIGWTLVHSAWQVALIAVAYIAAALILRRRSSNARYWLGCMALMAMVAWPAATFVALSSTSMPKPIRSIAAAVESFSHEQIVADAAALETAPRLSLGPMPKSGSNVEFHDPISPSAYSANAFRHWVRRLELALPWLTVFWLSGVCLLAVRPLWGLMVVRGLRSRGLVPLATDLRKLAGQLMVRLRVEAAVQFAESSLVEVPTVVGYFRPMVLLPATALTGLSTDQLELVLAHELAHIRRHDYLVNLLQTAIEALLFYHPGMWWVSSQVRRERENCCDDVAMSVCGNRGQYIRALYALESRRRTDVPALAATGGSLVQRVRRLAYGPNDATDLDRTSAWLAGLIVFGVVAAVLSLGQASADAVPPEANAAIGTDPPTVETEAKSSAPSNRTASQAEIGSENANHGPSPESSVRNKPWLATGRVTDVRGEPMSGVEISAFAGHGTLRKTGATKTDSTGRYRLTFDPGILVLEDSNAVQAATIYASKPGYFEQNLNRQGDFVAGQSQLPEVDERWGRKPKQVFLPGIPQAIDFVMLPAAVLEGEFVETSHNWNVREQSFSLAGEELPPSSSVLTSVTTDRKGRFRVDGVPTGRDWRISMRVPHTGIDIESEPLRFEEPGVYRCKLLLETTSADGSVKMSLRMTDLQHLATAADVRAIDQLDADGFSKLHRAASGGHVGKVRELLDAGANVNVQQGTYHGTPLQYASSNGHGETVQTLLDHSAKIEAKDAAGRTPLLWAASKGHADVVRRLLDAGADVNAAANGGWTALHYAVDRSHDETAQLLVDRGANVYAKNSLGKTPFDLNPSLNLRIPWKSLERAELSSRVDRPTRVPQPITAKSITVRPSAVGDPQLPVFRPDQIVAEFRGKPIRWRAIAPSVEWYEQRAEYERKNGHTLGYESPNDFPLSRLREMILKPIFEDYKIDHELAPTEQEISEFIAHLPAARAARKREAREELQRLKKWRDVEQQRLDASEPGSPAHRQAEQSIARYNKQIEIGERSAIDLFPKMEVDQERFYAQWQIGNWKLQKSLYKQYGGRAIWQQVGPEAIDAMRDYLREQEREGTFTIHDPSLRERFWKIYAPEKLLFEISEPDRVFAQPWTLLNEPEGEVKNN